MTAESTRSVVWRRTDGSTIEHCTFDPARRTLEGTVVGIVDGVPLTCTYVVQCAEDWTTRDVMVDANRAGQRSRLALSRRGGVWHMDGRPRPEFDEYPDIDLSITPATNTLPIRRLKLSIGETRTAKAVWLLFPDLAVQPLEQAYTRSGERGYAYVTADGAFRAELDVDDDGLIVRYGTLWEPVRESGRART
jgi:hypothetical protein